MTQARANATAVNINADELTEENLQRFTEAQNQLTGALKSLLAVSEAYPDLKANENFRDLQVQLEGTEKPHFSSARALYRGRKGLQHSYKEIPDYHLCWMVLDLHPSLSSKPQKALRQHLQ